MIEFLIDNIFVQFGGRVFQLTIGIPIGTNCASLLADIFLNPYEADFLDGLLKQKQKQLAQRVNFSFRYIDDVLSLNSSRFGDFLHPYTQASSNLKILQTLSSLHLILTFISKLTQEED